ncbi:ABC transporter permease [Lignipirellula cremea]|uniref:Dipeptide transport system permease protein DppB n=1 Tax=Lignipirellula cremea TaxID=2528010 RepID=A0A518DYH6_9BACT|nr:ABC transporter permease [Lignipirellula cremea]QDU96898.1 Dipeptide transport system permease protein DppB [Lignipirellula cremea]
MAAFLIKRLLWLAVTLWIVFTITFFLMRSVPGGPFDAERRPPPDIERNLKRRFNFDKPIGVQYLMELGKVVRGDLGVSYKKADFTVNQVVAQGFPVSASLGIFALTFAVVLGTFAGVISAVRRYSVWDFGLMSAATLGIAVPNFVLASLAIILLVFDIQLFPAAGWGSLRQMVLPALCLGAPFAGYIARLTRTGMMEVLSRDYIRTAYAKGLSERKVVIRHALRGAILPVVSYLGPATAGILTGSLVVEKIFLLPGMGTHFVEAALQRDYTLAMGMVLVYTLLLFTMNTLVDLSYAVIDPRVKME